MGTSLGVQAQEKSKFKFNEVNHEAVEKASAKDEKVFFDLNKAIFQDPDFEKGAIFSVEIEKGVFRDYQVIRMQKYIGGVVSMVAREAENKENIFSFSYTNGRINGLMHDSHNKSLQFTYDNESNANYIVESSNTEAELTCKVHDFSEIAHPEIEGNRKIKPKGYAPSSMSMTSLADDSTVIDLMIVYTDEAETWAADTSSFGSIEAVISQAMNLSQAALDNSELEIELRLVHVHKTDYTDDEGDTDSNTHLTRLRQQGDGYMDEVHTLREDHGADVIAVLAHVSDTGGLGYVLNRASGREDLGFNLNRVQQVGSGYTLIHEIGHNMGNAHSRTQTSSAASAKAGLFHYSAGYQDQANSFHTVMAYSDGLQQAPLFSSPDLLWNGNPAGTNSFETPENNARSMAEVKRVMAAYKLSKTLSPIATSSRSSIEVEIEEGQQQTEVITISNPGGESLLMWDVDFEFATTSAKRANKVLDSDAVVAKEFKREGISANLPPRQGAGNKFKNIANEEIVYSTSFEEGEGFAENTYTAINLWRTLGGNEFQVSSASPSTGSNHMRLEYVDQNDPSYLAGPFLGLQPFGNYEISVSLALIGTASSSETFDVYIYDDRTGDLSSAIIIEGGTLYVYDGNGGFSATGQNLSTDQYYDLNIRYNTEEQVIGYYLDGQLISEQNYATGFTPDEIWFLNRNGESGSILDIDDLEVKRMEYPYSWLSTNTLGGSVQEDGSVDLELNFNASGVSVGTYATNLKIYTNDPNNEVIEIPVTLTVNTSVSNEDENVKPDQISLAQNYPNPFNPTTTIKYNLAVSENVQLDIFNIQGKKVRSLIKDQKKAAGQHEITFNAADLSSGIYVYRLKTPTQTLTRKMVLIK